MSHLLNGYLITFVLFFVLPLLAWLVMLARQAQVPHARKAANCVMYSPERDWRGDPVAPVGKCTHHDCARRR